MNAKIPLLHLDACKTPSAVIFRLISCANVNPDTLVTAKSSAKVSFTDGNDITT